MKAIEKWPALAKGLGQIPKKDLRRLKVALEDKASPLIFNGAIRKIRGSVVHYCPMVAALPVREQKESAGCGLVPVCERRWRVPYFDTDPECFANDGRHHQYTDDLYAAKRRGTLRVVNELLEKK